MVLASRRWGALRSECIVCIHGVTQHGGIFAELGKRLAANGHAVVAVDLRGHGESGRLPPWNTEAHVADLLETLDALEIERVTWVGHSFGGRLAAAVAAASPERAERLALLDPALRIPAEAALRGAEIERLDWSFATPEGAVNALLSAEQMVAPSRDAVTAYARDDLREGPDGRFRFSFCPSAAVVAWNEMVLGAPPIALVPTLVVWPAAARFDGTEQALRYREALGDLLTAATVPNGHNVLWESPAETIAAIEEFVAP